jgi:hypothetical protein
MATSLKPLEDRSIYISPKSIYKIENLLILIMIALACALVGALFVHAYKLPNGINSYGALGEAFINGRLHLENGCPEIDCAVRAEKTFVIFPPFPALLALPFVLLFGPSFKIFALLAIAAFAATLLVWTRIVLVLGTERQTAFWLVAALAFASPLYGVTLQSHAVWGFAQSVGVLMISLAIWSAIDAKQIFIATVFLGCAFLCRQMAIVCFPAILILAQRRDFSWLRPGRKSLTQIAGASFILSIFVAAYCAYNYARFGAPLETGYQYISNADNNFMRRRIDEIGLFSAKYFMQNAIYMLFEGFHISFSGKYMTDLGQIDGFGTSLIVASPWILMAIYMKFDKTSAVLITISAFVLLVTLFYHSNGYKQLNMQRYTLDWLPLIFLLLCRSPRHDAFAALPVLVIWGTSLNLVALALKTMTSQDFG